MIRIGSTHVDLENEPWKGCEDPSEQLFVCFGKMKTRRYQVSIFRL